MAHKEQQEYVESLKVTFPDQFVNKKVLEVGSLDINGSVRQFFENCDYIGIDVGEGRGVDLVVAGQEYDAPDNSYDTVISCECLEHNPFWMETFINMHRLCKPGGLVVMTCATTGRAEHGTTRSQPGCSPHTLQWDYYKNLVEEDFTSALKCSLLFSEFKFTTKGTDLQFYGIKQ